jgi:hypothetical protein
MLDNKSVQTALDHEARISRMEALMELLANNSTKLADNVVKQEVILEKLTNLESSFNKTILELRREHEELEDRHEEKHQEQERKLKLLTPVIFLMEYPKIIIFVLTLLYLLAIQEIRTEVAKILNLIK